MVQENSNRSITLSQPALKNQAEKLWAYQISYRPSIRHTAARPLGSAALNPRENGGLRPSYRAVNKAYAAVWTLNACGGFPGEAAEARWAPPQNRKMKQD